MEKGRVTWVNPAEAGLYHSQTTRDLLQGPDCYVREVTKSGLAACLSCSVVLLLAAIAVVAGFVCLIIL